MQGCDLEHLRYISAKCHLTWLVPILMNCGLGPFYILTLPHFLTVLSPHLKGPSFCNQLSPPSMSVVPFPSKSIFTEPAHSNRVLDLLMGVDGSLFRPSQGSCRWPARLGKEASAGFPATAPGDLQRVVAALTGVAPNEWPTPGERRLGEYQAIESRGREGRRAYSEPLQESYQEGGVGWGKEWS